MGSATEAHTCEHQGRFGRLAPSGECPRCDAIREEKTKQQLAEDDKRFSKITAEMDYTTMKTYEALEQEPKVPVLLPSNMRGLPSDRIQETSVPVVVNCGVRYNVPRGKECYVPKTVYEILRDSGYIGGKEAVLDIPKPFVYDWPVGAI